MKLTGTAHIADFKIEDPEHRFTRDRLTWLGYLLIGIYCFVYACFGPAMPFLRGEMHLTYTVTAFHFSAAALGSLMAGFVGDKVSRKLGRPRTMWLGTCGIVLGMVILVLATNPVLTIFSTWFICFTGSQMNQTVIATMADRFRAERALGITESNIAGSLFSAVAPFALGMVMKVGCDWRAVVVFPIIMLLVLYFTNRRTIPEWGTTSHSTASTGSLPKAYWAYFAVIFFSVASEWSTVFWSADFLHDACHLSKADASVGVSVFLVSMLVGRIIGRRLAKQISTDTLLPIAASMAALGSMVFWLGHGVAINLTGLALLGLGEANVYPLSLAAAIGIASGQTTRATARMSISTGAAILFAPLMIGIIADRTNIGNAYGLVALLLTLSAAMVLIANVYAQRHYKLQPAAIKSAD